LLSNAPAGSAQPPRSSMNSRTFGSVRSIGSPEFGFREHMGQNPPFDQHHPG
jgi:hypothetical protein